MAKYQPVSGRLAWTIAHEAGEATGRQFAPTVVGVGSPTTFLVIEVREASRPARHYHWRWNRRDRTLTPDGVLGQAHWRSCVERTNVAGRIVARWDPPEGAPGQP